MRPPGQYNVLLKQTHAVRRQIIWSSATIACIQISSKLRLHLSVALYVLL